MTFKTAVWNVGVSNSVDPDQDQRSVGPDLDPDCLYIIHETYQKKY